MSSPEDFPKTKLLYQDGDGRPKKTKIAPWLHGMDNTYALNKVHASFEGGRGEGGELFASKGWNLGGGVFCAGQSPGPAGWLVIFIIFFFYFLFFLLPYLTYMYLANLGPFFFPLYEEGLLTRRRVPYSSQFRIHIGGISRV